MNRHLRLACVALSCVALGCSHIVRPPLEKEVTRHADPPWMRVEGYTGRDGTQHKLSGYAWITQDSFLVYATKPHSTDGVWTPKGGSAHLAALGRPDVDRVHVKRIDPAKTVVMVAVVGVFVGGVIAIALSLADEYQYGPSL